MLTVEYNNVVITALNNIFKERISFVFETVKKGIYFIRLLHLPNLELPEKIQET